MKDKSRETRNKFIKEMIKRGISKAELCDVFGLTRQGLHLILKKKKS